MSYGFDPYESLALCSGQCQASRYPPASCRCPCQGRNHGILRGGRVFDVQARPREESFYPQYLPEDRLRLLARDLDATRLPDLSQNRGPFFENRTPKPAGPQLTVKKGKYRIAKALGRSFKHAMAGYSQEERNRQVIQGLHQQFIETNVEAIIDGAYQLFYMRDNGANRPELYELYESGHIDKAAEALGKHWAVGRPRR